MSTDPGVGFVPRDAGRFWIIGAGRFGRIAVRRITRRYPDAALTVVDIAPAGFESRTAAVVRADGVRWLFDQLDDVEAVDMIVPAVPLHLAAEWLRLSLSGDFDARPATLRESWLDRMPNPMRGGPGQVLTSHADFICPDDCPEPGICTRTGRPRPPDLYRLLEGLDLPDVRPVVLRSRQLLPGVGGLRPADLIDAREAARASGGGLLMIATACLCHGVVDFMHLDRR